MRVTYARMKELSPLPLPFSHLILLYVYDYNQSNVHVTYY